jgi:hypothetical protein
LKPRNKSVFLFNMEVTSCKGTNKTARGMIWVETFYIACETCRELCSSIFI